VRLPLPVPFAEDDEMFDVDVNEEIGRDEAVVERERTRTP
jgi:hypothetical protein